MEWPKPHRKQTTLLDPGTIRVKGHKAGVLPHDLQEKIVKYLEQFSCTHLLMESVTTLGDYPFFADKLLLVRHLTLNQCQVTPLMLTNLQLNASILSSLCLNGARLTHSIWNLLPASLAVFSADSSFHGLQDTEGWRTNLSRWIRKCEGRLRFLSLHDNPCLSNDDVKFILEQVRFHGLDLFDVSLTSLRAGDTPLQKVKYDTISLYDCTNRAKGELDDINVIHKAENFIEPRDADEEPSTATFDTSLVKYIIDLPPLARTAAPVEHVSITERDSLEVQALYDEKGCVGDLYDAVKSIRAPFVVCVRCMNAYYNVYVTDENIEIVRMYRAPMPKSLATHIKAWLNRILDVRSRTITTNEAVPFGLPYNPIEVQQVWYSAADIYRRAQGLEHVRPRSLYEIVQVAVEERRRKALLLDIATGALDAENEGRKVFTKL